MITPKDLIKQMKADIKQFGTYTWYDKGPSEVMDLHDIYLQLSLSTAEEIYEFLKELRGKTSQTSDRARLTAHLIYLLQDLKFKEEEWELISSTMPEGW